MTHPYHLRSARLGFGRWSPEDIDLAMALWGDARVTTLIGGPFSEAQVRERLAREIENEAVHGFQYWPLFLSSDGAHVGCCGLKPYPEPGILEMGFQLRFEHWGQGYASEAAREVIRHAFAALGIRALFAGHHPKNEPSRRLLEKLGFRYVRHELYPPTGLEHPGYLLTATGSRAILKR